MTTPTLHDSWLNLVAALGAECMSAKQDPGVLETYELTLKVSLPLTDGSRFAREFTAREVTDEPRGAAAMFYREYVAARQRGSV